MSDTSPNIESLSFEDALARLEQIVRRLETGQTDLEAAIKDYELGDALKRHCEKKLGQAKLKIDKIIKSSDGRSTAQTQPADIA